MAFIQAAAPYGRRDVEALSADNAPPERHIVVDLIRRAAPLLGLKPPVIATLEAMLGCLAPKRRHHTVFASNATLVFRRNGISDRTLRRHVVQLADCGLLIRHDSPNRKRFTRHDPQGGQALRFGFDLTPLFNRLQEIAQLAARAAHDAERLAYLRCKLRAAAQQALIKDIEDADAQAALQALRRKLTTADCEAMLEMLAPPAALGLPDQGAAAQATQPSASAPSASMPPTTMTANDGQNVRHHQRSRKENSEEELLSIADLLTACPEAAQFSLGKITTVPDVIRHADTLAPMIGIDAANYQAARSRLGPLAAALTVWAITESHGRINRIGAYFRAITTGTRSDGFDPFRLISRLARRSAKTQPGGTTASA
ncbi:MAG TPA: replication protein C [Paracoccus sp.]|nr:replication protein C [Paracoccus sp. (in: a-proteobacteria)]